MKIIVIKGSKSLAIALCLCLKLLEILLAGIHDLADRLIERVLAPKAIQAVVLKSDRPPDARRKIREALVRAKFGSQFLVYDHLLLALLSTSLLLRIYNVALLCHFY